MKLYLVHHADALSAEQDPQRHISALGCRQADRIGDRLSALSVASLPIYFSEKQWTIDTAQRIAQKLGAQAQLQQASYPINTDDPIAPFIKDLGLARGDVMMCGHVDYLLRVVSYLLCGDEKRKVVEFKPGNGTLICLEGQANQWAVIFAWRQDHAPG